MGAKQNFLAFRIAQQFRSRVEKRAGCRPTVQHMALLFDDSFHDGLRCRPFCSRGTKTEIPASDDYHLYSA